MANILVIDDELPMRRLLVRLLTRAGHTVHAAEDGQLGLALFHKVEPELVITDIVMPEMEGIETIRELRRNGPAVPILAISGGATPLYLHAAAELGATAALPKPFATDALLSTVNELLGAAAPKSASAAAPTDAAPDPGSTRR
jgi:CheY-like chemotaxis protein